MASQDDGSSVKEKIEEVAGNGSKSKEALTAAAVSAVGALAASKGPDLIRKVMGATEEKGDSEIPNSGRRSTASRQFSSVTPKFSSIFSDRSQPGVTPTTVIGLSSSSALRPMTIRSTFAFTRS